MTQLAINIGFVIALMFLCTWLEGIGGKHGLIDEWLTPVPLAFSGGVLVFFERVFA